MMTESRLSKYQQAERAHLIAFMTVLQKCPIFISLFILNGDRYKVPLEQGSYQLCAPSYFEAAVADPNSLDLKYFSDHPKWDADAARECRGIFTDHQSYLSKWPAWIRISTYDRQAVHYWFNSAETQVERQAFLDAGLLLSVDVVWTWQHRVDATDLRPRDVVSATEGDSRIRSNTRYHHVYRIFSSRLYDPTSEQFQRACARVTHDSTSAFNGHINGSPSAFFDQQLFTLIEKIVRLRGEDHRFAGGCGSHRYTSDGVAYSNSSRQNCELVHDIWRVYAGNDDTAVKYYLDSSTRPSYHRVAIGAAAIAHFDELAAIKANRIKSLPAHQPRQYPNELTELREKIFSDDIFN